MAVDTRDRRASVVQLLTWPVHTPPLPDGSLTAAADRLHLVHLYRGIEPAAPAQIRLLALTDRLVSTAILSDTARGRAALSDRATGLARLSDTGL